MTKLETALQNMRDFETRCHKLTSEVAALRNNLRMSEEENTRLEKQNRLWEVGLTAANAKLEMLQEVFDRFVKPLESPTIKSFGPIKMEARDQTNQG